MTDISYWLGPGQSFIFCVKHPYILKRAQVKLWQSTLLTPENRSHTLGLDVSPNCAMGTLSLLSLHGKAEDASTPRSSGGVAALIWATIIQPALTAAQQWTHWILPILSILVFPKCCRCALRGTDHGGRCCIFPTDFTSLCHHTPMEVNELLITVFKGSRIRDKQSQDRKWPHRLSNPVICNHKQLHPLSDVRLHPEIRQVSLPSVPESRTSLIRRESL